MAPNNMLLTEENSEYFFGGRDKPMKAILFTKKMETPNLWLRVAEAYDARCDFGEVRLAEETLMKKFDLTVEILPKIIALRTSRDGTQETIVYEGPNDFEKICEFLRDAADGGKELIELKRQVEELTRAIRGLKAEVAQEQETTKAARAEAARLKLSQVGQVEAVRKSLESELQQAQARESDLKSRMDTEISELKEQLQAAKKEHEVMSKEVEMLRAMQGESPNSALMLEPETLDTFLDNTSRPLKAVLITKKEEIPELWQQLAEAHFTLCSFGMVRHVHESILQSFSVRVESLPRILLIGSRSTPPLVYEGPLKLENISAFINDAVQGGSACVELRKQLLASTSEVDGLRRDLAETKRASQVQRDQVELARREQVGALESTIKSLQAQLKAACAGAGAEMQRVRTDADARVRAAESMAEELSAELVRERQSTQDKIQEAMSRKEAQLKADRQKLEQATWTDEVMERELKLAEKAARTCERAVLKAASAVHVSLVRSARENERTHAALREFIDDIAPSQVQAPTMDPRLLREAMNGDDSAGVIDKMNETISNQYKLLKQKLHIPDDASDGVGGGSGVGDGTGIVKDQMRRALQFMSLGRGAGSDGAGSESGNTRNEYSSDGNSTKGGGHGGGSRAGAGGGSGGVARSAGGGGKGAGANSKDKGGGGKHMDSTTLQKLKKKQAKELVSLRGYTDVTIGQLTREVQKTKVKHVFTWKDLRLRLLYDGPYRDRLIDDETGGLVYSYPREIEIERQRRKVEGGGDGGGIDDMSSRQSDGTGGGLESGSTTPRVVVPGHAAAGSVKSKGDWFGVGGTSVQSGGGSNRSGGTWAAPGGVSGTDDSRSINRDGSNAAARMPALVNGVLVLAPAKSAAGSGSGLGGGVGHDSSKGGIAGGGWHSGNSEPEIHGGGSNVNIDSAQRSHMGSRVLAGPAQDKNQDLGEWGAVAESRSRLPVSIVAPSIWSDDEEGGTHQSGGGIMDAHGSTSAGAARGASRSLDNRRNGGGFARGPAANSRGASEASSAAAHSNGRGLGGGMWGGGGGVLRGTGSPRSGTGSGSDGGFGSGGSANGVGGRKGNAGGGGSATPPGGVPADLLMANITAKDLGDAAAAPTARGAFSLSAIQARDDGREDASARTRMLLMDHNAPDPAASRSVWNRLF